MEAPSGSRRRIAVIGGGISGLAAAHRLVELGGPQVEVSLFEASAKLGGVIGTERIGEYLVETGPDMFITNKPEAVALCERLGLKDRLVPTDSTHRRSLVLRRGRPVEVPDGFQLLSPVKVWPVLASPIFSPWGKLRMGLEYVLPRRTSGEDESLAAFVRRRFGQEALDRLIQPLVGGIYTSDPERLSLKATLPRFLDMEARHGSLIRALRHQANQSGEGASGARYGLFVTLKTGLAELVTALETRLEAACHIHRNTAVRAIQKESSSYRLGGASGSADVFDAVVVALPAYRAAELIGNWLPHAAQRLQQIEYASAAIVVSGHTLSDIRHPMDAFGLVIPAIEQRRILAVSFASRKFPDRAPPGHVLLRTFVGGAMQPQELERSDVEIGETVRAELGSIFGVGGTADFLKVVRWSRAMPQYHVGHLDRVTAIEAELKPHPTIKLAGNAYRGVGIPDCIQSGEAAAESLLQQWK